MVGRIIGSGDKTRYVIDGKDVSKEEFEEHFPDKPLGGCASLIGWKKPLHSDALAVHPKQIKEATKHAAKMGVPVDFAPDGRPIFKSRKQRADYMKAHGFYDRSGGYSDSQRGSTILRDSPPENLDLFDEGEAQ